VLGFGPLTSWYCSAFTRTLSLTSSVAEAADRDPRQAECSTAMFSRTLPPLNRPASTRAWF